MEELKNNEVELGVVQYEISNAKSIYDAPTGKVGAKGWAQRIYMILLGIALFGWFVYSVVNTAIQEGFVSAAIEHALALFVLLVSELILMLTAFGGWGKFARLAMKNRSLTRQHRMEGLRTDQLEEELRAADANKGIENAIRIYRDYVVVVNKGNAITLNQFDIRLVKCNATPKGYQLTFETYDNRKIIANEMIPSSDLPLMKKFFERYEDANAERPKGYLRKKFPMLAFAFIPLIIGIALVIVHSLVLPEMPVVFGIIFMAFGVVFITAQFNDIAVVKYGVMGIFGGILLIGFPVCIALTIADLVEEITYAALFAPFTAFHAVFGLFVGLGPMLIISGIAGIIDCSRM